MEPNIGDSIAIVICFPLFSNRIRGIEKLSSVEERGSIVNKYF